MENQVSLFTKIISIFWEPEKTFKALNEKISALDIIIPLLLVCIVAWVTIPITTPIAVKEQKAKFLNSDYYENMSETQQEQTMARFDKQGNTWIAYIISPIVVTLFTAIFGLILVFVSNFLLGGDRKFKEMWAVGLYVGLIDLVASAVKIPLMVQKNSTKIYTSVAIFMEESSSFLFRFMTKMDIFSIWKIIVLAIALSIFTKKDITKPLVIMIILWLIYCIGAAALAGLNPIG